MASRALSASFGDEEEVAPVLSTVQRRSLRLEEARDALALPEAQCLHEEAS